MKHLAALLGLAFLLLPACADQIEPAEPATATQQTAVEARSRALAIAIPRDCPPPDGSESTDPYRDCRLNYDCDPLLDRKWDEMFSTQWEHISEFDGPLQYPDPYQSPRECADDPQYSSHTFKFDVRAVTTVSRTDDAETLLQDGDPPLPPVVSRLQTYIATGGLLDQADSGEPIFTHQPFFLGPIWIEGQRYELYIPACAYHVWMCDR